MAYYTNRTVGSLKLLMLLTLTLLSLTFAAAPIVYGNTQTTINNYSSSYCVDSSDFFIDSGQEIGDNSATIDTELGDLDGDGDLDAFVANVGKPNEVWFNNGTASFTNSEQLLGNFNSYAAALADLDGDGDLDAFVANGNDQPNKVYFNEGDGSFTEGEQDLVSGFSYGVALGDIDGDGDIDAIVASLGDENLIYWNDSSGQFITNGQSVGDSSTTAVKLGDIDGNGTLDAILAKASANSAKQINEVWLNSGSSFSLAQKFGGGDSFDIDLGDLDNDGDLDVFIVNGYNQPNKVWLNENGTLVDSEQFLGSLNSRYIELADLDGDSDLDAVVGNVAIGQPNTVWFNDGSAIFNNTGQSLDQLSTMGGALGDIDSDGDIDAFIGGSDTNVPSTVWLNGICASGGELWLGSTPASVVIEETVDVELMFDAGATDVYGVDIVLTYDPTIVSVLDITAGSCLDNPFLEEIDDGIIHVAAAAAETDACTTGSAAVITFQGDVGGISPVEFDTWEISDGVGQPITLDATDGSIEVLTNGDVTGQVDLQGRADDESGAIVTLLDGSTVIATTTTDAAGNYAFDVLAGTYDITVEHPSYLDAEKSDIVVLAGSATTLNPVTLLAGDVNDSGCVDIFDVASIAAQFESTSPSPTHLDVNGDGVISITDISLAAYDNYQTCELIPWP